MYQVLGTDETTAHHMEDKWLKFEESVLRTECCLLQHRPLQQLGGVAGEVKEEGEEGVWYPDCSNYESGGLTI